MAKDLKSVYDLRQLSDYEADLSLTLEEAAMALDAAVGFVNRAQSYLEQD